MAWNPSPEVQVARDAASRLGTLDDRENCWALTPEGETAFAKLREGA